MASRRENSASRTRSDVGRVPRAGTFSTRPFASPATIRVMDLLYWFAAWTYIAATGPRATIISVSIGHDVAYAGRLCVAPGSMLVIAMSAYVLVLVVMFAAKERR